MKEDYPCYLTLSEEQLLKIRNELVSALKECKICPRKCKVNRIQNQPGFCKTGRLARVASFNLHFGEEKELAGKKGSGTIFFSYCNLDCIYCQNYDISHLDKGTEVTPTELAFIMFNLQSKGAQNINLVTPSHLVPQIIEALVIAREKGLKIPLVYNSGGYDSVNTLEKMNNIFDIYMPDIKYSREEESFKYSQVKDYWDVSRKALLEMHRQVGDLVLNKAGFAKRGLIIRHLVLPDDIGGSFAIIDFIAENISKDSYLNIMDQYRPCYKAKDHPELARRITTKEYQRVLDYAKQKGLNIKGS